MNWNHAVWSPLAISADRVSYSEALYFAFVFFLHFALSRGANWGGLQRPRAGVSCLSPLCDSHILILSAALSGKLLALAVWQNQSLSSHPSSPTTLPQNQHAGCPFKRNPLCVMAPDLSRAVWAGESQEHPSWERSYSGKQTLQASH